ncbi:leucine-rich repeat-containing protein 56 isoform X2 [Rhineura floridana]|uniref:leucine-rich repeat-containing protein 56 isoform X2 n=1 Tax=Rhineura floridana TaxID=261503 RepID=UPI002AC86717|nr:leucine-rich repeat-containing protein 56 isoform X2 [Rhineura floridana]
MLQSLPGHSEMELNWRLGRVSRPGSATVRVTNLGWQGLLNPNPSIKDDDEDLLVDEYLSPNKLKTLTGLDDLRQVKALEMRVDTRENSLGNFGAYVPNLKHLKLNSSVLMSVRDLGTALSHLQVLWMARCGLPDLDGISSCGSLKELYIAYNNIADLSQLSLLEHLEILDLEGNNIEDLSQIQYLGICVKLSALTVEGNLICLKPSPQSPEVPDYNYRAEVKKLIPHLKCLDEIPANQTDLPFPCKMNKDWLLVKESIKDGSLVEEASCSDSYSGPVARRPSSAVRSTTTQFLTASRPQTPQRPPSAHLLSGSSTLLEKTTCDEMLPDDDSSDLTHGVSRVICGNPIKALHARRQKLSSAVMNLFQPLCQPAEDPSGIEETDYVNGEDIYAELKVLKEHHYQHLLALQRVKSPEVLKITHNDEEEEHHCLSDSCDEDLKESIQEEIMEIISSDSHLSQTSSDSLHIQENVLPAIIKHSLVPSPPKCPSPASVQRVTTGFVRVRHLKVPSSKKALTPKLQSLSTVNSDAVQNVVEKTAVLNLSRKADASLSDASVLGQRHRTSGADNKPTRRPVSATGPTNIRAFADRNVHKTINSHQPLVRSCTNVPEGLAVLNRARPLTAKAALQSLPNRPHISTAAQSRSPKL